MCCSVVSKLNAKLDSASVFFREERMQCTDSGPNAEHHEVTIRASQDHNLMVT